jgi:hypothetical protein
VRQIKVFDKLGQSACGPIARAVVGRDLVRDLAKNNEGELFVAPDNCLLRVTSNKGARAPRNNKKKANHYPTGTAASRPFPQANLRHNSDVVVCQLDLHRRNGSCEKPEWKK